MVRPANIKHFPHRLSPFAGAASWTKGNTTPRITQGNPENSIFRYNSQIIQRQFTIGFGGGAPMKWSIHRLNRGITILQGTGNLEVIMTVNCNSNNNNNSNKASIVLNK